MTYAASSQQLPPAYTMTTVAADVNFDITGLVNPQYSITAVEASAPQVVGSLPPSEEFDAPVYNQIHQQQIVAGETTQNMVENPSVQEQVIVQEIPQDVGSLPRWEEFHALVYDQFHQEQAVARWRPSTELKIHLCKNR